MSVCIISYTCDTKNFRLYAEFLRLCIKVIHIIHNICTKFRNCGEIFVDILDNLSTISTFIHSFDIFCKKQRMYKKSVKCKMKR